MLCAVVSFTLNIIFLYKPILGAPKSSIMAYLKDWGWNRMIAYAAGIICGLGNTFQFMGGQVTYTVSPLPSCSSGRNSNVMMLRGSFLVIQGSNDAHAGAWALLGVRWQEMQRANVIVHLWVHSHGQTHLETMGIVH